jgi:hypothetical protein
MKFPCRRFGVVALACTTASAFTTLSAFGYSTRSIVSDACHESISIRAVRQARAELPSLMPTEAETRDDRALLDDLPFELDSDVADLGTATLILGNRDNDLKGLESDDLDLLATVHGSPALQREHCLRGPDQDVPGGSEAALEDCRQYIREQVQSALAGVDASGVDGDVRIPIEVVLEFRGSVKVSLPLFYVEMGRALHALQDGFSHTYRVPTDQRVVSQVLNYVEILEEEKYVESRDGPPHSSPLDECQNLDAPRRERLDLAMRASADLLRAALDPALDETARMASIDLVLDEYLSHEPTASQVARGFTEGCRAGNDWCEAPEEQYEQSSGCSLAPRAPRRIVWPIPALLFAAVACLRRRRRGSLMTALPLALGALALVPTARAQEVDESPPEQAAIPEAGEEEPKAVAVPDADAQSGVAVADVTPMTSEREPFPFGMHLHGAIAVENPAFAAGVGLRYRVSSNLLLGVDGEWNPFWSLDSGNVRTGTANFFVTGVIRFPLDFQRVNLRTTLEAGGSRMLFDLVGVPQGSMGLFFGISPLGIDYEISRSVYLVIEPSHIAIPIPQLSGVPYAYPQYRFTIGVQIGA